MLKRSSSVAARDVEVLLREGTAVAVPGAVGVLTRGVLRAMFLNNMRKVAAALAAVVVAGSGIGGVVVALRAAGSREAAEQGEGPWRPQAQKGLFDPPHSKEELIKIYDEEQIKLDDLVREASALDSRMQELQREIVIAEEATDPIEAADDVERKRLWIEAEGRVNGKRNRLGGHLDRSRWVVQNIREKQRRQESLRGVLGFTPVAPPSAAPIQNAPPLEQRLQGLEQKLDRVLKAVEEQRRNTGR